MKKIVLAMAAGAAMIAGSVAMNGPTGSAASTDVVSRSAPSTQTQQTPPAPQQNKAIRETRALPPSRYWRGVPTALKNRAPGERAHRRWRKTRSAGQR